MKRRELQQIVGVPFLPPARATQVVFRLRRILRAAHRRSAPPSVQILEGLFGLFDNRVLALLVELDIPDLLTHPIGVEELAARTATEAGALERVLRYAASRGYVRRDRHGRYRANGVTTALRRDHRNSWRGWVEFVGSSWYWDSWRHLDAAVRGKSNGIEAATGHDFFDFVNHVQPDAGAAFNLAMQAGATLHAVLLLGAFDWSQVRHVCDVGGGTGAAIEELLRARSGLRATLVDLPEVVASARPALVDGPLARRCDRRGGSFFDPLPAGADRYLLLVVLHDWDDEHAVAILRRVADALPAHGRAIIVEKVLRADGVGDDLTLASDLIMLALASGHERDDRQFDVLFGAGGLRVEQRVLLGSGFTAFVAARAAFA